MPARTHNGFIGDPTTTDEISRALAESMIVEVVETLAVVLEPFITPGGTLAREFMDRGLVSHNPRRILHVTHELTPTYGVRIDSSETSA